MKAFLASGTAPIGAACPNCRQPGPHFVPPSLGECGFYTCVRRVG